MEQSPEVTNLLNLINADLLVRIGLVAALVFYTIFAIFIVRQASLMAQVLHTRLSPLFKTFAYLHLILSLVVLLAVLILATS
jgi:hypothetical protein